MLAYFYYGSTKYAFYMHLPFIIITIIMDVVANIIHDILVIIRYAY